MNPVAYVATIVGCNAMMMETGCEGVRGAGGGGVCVCAADKDAWPWLLCGVCVDVSLSGNDLGAEGGFAIAGALSRLSSLTTLEYGCSEGGVCTRTVGSWRWAS